MLLVIATMIFLAIRLAGDLIFYSFGTVDSPFLTFWRISSSVVLIASVVLYYFSFSTETSIEDNSSLPDKFIKEYLRAFYFILVILLLIIISPEDIVRYQGGAKLFNFIVGDASGFGGVVVASFSISFMHRWLLLRRHKKTVTYLKVLGIALVYLMFIDVASNILPVLQHLNAFNIWVITLSGFVMLFVAKKNSWLASLPRNKKLKILWISLALMLSGMILFISLAEENNSYAGILRYYLPGSIYIIQASLLFISVYSVRMFFAVLASLPTTSIVERKTSELSTLTYLNRFISESAGKNSDQLIDTVSQLALHASGGAGAWIETYDLNTKTVSIGSAININSDAILAMHGSSRLYDIFSYMQKPMLIESVPETKELAFITTFLPQANSMIAVPLFQGNNRYGTLVVVDTEEFGFEYDDIKVLAAFGDNVNLALENARLMNDSLEKERIASELAIAKRIQSSLLPHKLPTFSNFEIFAESFPAEEVGGDYYDVAKFKNGNRCIVVGDVSGKGMSAAFYMAQLKGVVQSLAEQTESPSELLSKINRTIFGLMDRQSYITMLCVMINDEKGTISVARAGHPPLLIFRSGEMIAIQPKGIGIGLVRSKQFDALIEESETTLQDGDICVMLTDGITELRDNKGSEFGIDGVADIFKNGIKSNNQIITEVNNIINNKSLWHSHDDMTFVAICFNKSLN